jgi:transposase InsO family protein
VDTGEGWLYLATVLDLCSHRLLGYAMGAHHDAALAEDALRMVVAWSNPQPARLSCAVTWPLRREPVRTSRSTGTHRSRNSRESLRSSRSSA